MAKRRQDDGSAPGGISPDIWNLIVIFAAEVIGTGMLLYFGCMSLIVFEDAPVPHWKPPVVFTTVIMTIIQIFLHISGAHINPVVTLSFLIMGKVTPLASIVYVVAQCIGGVLGLGLLRLVTPCEIWDLSKNVVGEYLCATLPHPSLSTPQAIAVEFLATTIFVLTLCSVVDPRHEPYGSTISIKFGGLVMAIANSVGPYTGCSVNPARSLGPAIIYGVWQHQWIYWFAPLLASVTVTLFYQTMFAPPAALPPSQKVAEDVPLNAINDVKVKRDNEETNEVKS